MVGFFYILQSKRNLLIAESVVVRVQGSLFLIFFAHEYLVVSLIVVEVALPFEPLQRFHFLIDFSEWLAIIGVGFVEI